MEQYKLMNVQEQPLYNRLKFLDVMCCPTLFPDDYFGEYHQRDTKLSQSEYACLTKTPISGKTLAISFIFCGLKR